MKKSNIITNLSFLRWAGSKKKLLPILSSYWNNNFHRYIEPFAGSGQLYFSLLPKNAILGDINNELINCYKAIKNNPNKVYNYLMQFPLGKDHYYSLRAVENSEWEIEKKAARFIYLNTFCFNGLYRTNKKGHFNVPFSSKSGNLVSLEKLTAISYQLKFAEIENLDFDILVRKRCKNGDFIYLDPPYAVKNRQIFTQYDPASFGLTDLERLKLLLDFINEKEAKFLLSYALCEESLDLASKWNFSSVDTIRNISGFAKFRKSEKEILITNIV